MRYLWLFWHLLDPPLQKGEETVSGDSKGLPLALCPDLLSPLHLTLPLKVLHPCAICPPAAGREQVPGGWLQKSQGIEERWLHRKELKQTGKQTEDRIWLIWQVLGEL